MLVAEERLLDHVCPCWAGCDQSTRHVKETSQGWSTLMQKEIHLTGTLGPILLIHCFRIGFSKFHDDNSIRPRVLVKFTDRWASLKSWFRSSRLGPRNNVENRVFNQLSMCFLYSDKFENHWFKTVLFTWQQMGISCVIFKNIDAWVFPPTPRNSDLIGMWCASSIGNFLKLLDNVKVQANLEQLILKIVKGVHTPTEVIQVNDK